MNKISLILLTLLSLPINTSFAFVHSNVVKQHLHIPITTMNMGFMDGIKKAFENEDFNTTSKNGKSNKEKSKYTEICVDVCGRKISAVKGQKLKDIIRASGAPIKFNCEKGQCGSCEAFVNGKKMRTCRSIVTEPTTIKTR